MNTIKLARAEFVRGATRPSAGALLGTLCVTAGLIALCAWRITPQLLANHPGYFELDERDEFPSLTAGALKIAVDPPDGIDAVIIGDSAIREAVTDPADLERLINQKTNRPVHVKFLAAGGLTQWGMIGVSDAIREHVKGVVLLEISPMNLGRPPEEAGDFTRVVALPSEAYRDEVRAAGVRPPPGVGNYFLDNYRFFVARPAAVGNLFQGPVQSQQHQEEHKVPWSDKDWKRSFGRIWNWTASYDGNAARNLAIYRRMIERLRKNPDITVVLYKCIENPRNISQWRDKPAILDAVRKYDADVAAWRRKMTPGVPLLDIGAEAQLVPEDFWDSFHMMDDKARARFTSKLAEDVVRLLGESSPASAPVTPGRPEGSHS